jgi:hypothetical protein
MNKTEKAANISEKLRTNFLKKHLFGISNTNLPNGISNTRHSGKMFLLLGCVGTLCLQGCVIAQWLPCVILSKTFLKILR